MSAERATTNTVAVVVGGGPIAPPERSFDAVIVADSGLDVALAARLEPTLLVGDMDSISPAGLLWATEHSIPVERHPVDKDDTDTALALRCAVQMTPPHGDSEVMVLGADITSRLDHLLGTMMCLGDPVLASIGRVTAHLGATHVHVLHPGRRTTLYLDAGRVFSLLALHGRCDGVDVSDGRWPLTDATLQPGSTLGISNESLGRPITVAVTDGVLTIIVPELVS
jgi:thiamine pyrophosphokinase